jgi:hypothetical protein
MRKNRRYCLAHQNHRDFSATSVRLHVNIEPAIAGNVMCVLKDTTIIASG